jgi:hypothetical protein
MHGDASNSNGFLVGEVQRHEYTNSILNELIKWERISIEPSSENLQTSRHKLSRMQQDLHSISLESVPHEAGDYHDSAIMLHLFIKILNFHSYAF